MADQYELCMNAVIKDGRVLRFIHPVHRTMEMCSAAVDNNGYAIEYVPDEKMTYQMCVKALEKDIDNIKFIAQRDERMNQYDPEIYSYVIKTCLSADWPFVRGFIKCPDFKIRCMKCLKSIGFWKRVSYKHYN